MDTSEYNQLLTVLTVMQQDMHELKYKYSRIIIEDKLNLSKQFNDIQIRLTILESILKKHFGSDFVDDTEIIKKMDLI